MLAAVIDIRPAIIPGGRIKSSNQADGWTTRSRIQAGGRRIGKISTLMSATYRSVGNSRPIFVSLKTLTNFHASRRVAESSVVLFSFLLVVPPLLCWDHYFFMHPFFQTQKHFRQNVDIRATFMNDGRFRPWTFCFANFSNKIFCSVQIFEFQYFYFIVPMTVWLFL